MINTLELPQLLTKLRELQITITLQDKQWRRTCYWRVQKVNLKKILQSYRYSKFANFRKFRQVILK